MKKNYQALQDLGVKENFMEFMEEMAKRWLAHDGLWFQTLEKEYGMETAIKIDAAVWEKFSTVEAQRIKRFFRIPEGGGIAALKKALGLRFYAFVNKQEIIELDENRIIFRMNDCRVQSARQRKGLPDFPCKSVGLAEYESFARTIDSRIKTRCLTCPPDDHPAEYYCAWEFWI